jgi:NAD(P)-dependent dehydrogenase (short-subunit alcohol dehydrogenase family)
MSSKPIALVTGASSGIGRTSAIALILAGWRVVLSGRRKEELEATAEMARTQLREAGKEEEAKDEGLVLVCVGDVAKEGNVKEMFDEVKRVYGECKKRRALRCWQKTGAKRGRIVMIIISAERNAHRTSF